MDIYGTDFPTPDGTGIRDYIHVSDLARAHSAALAHLRRGVREQDLQLWLRQGASVLEVVDSVRRISGREFPVEVCGRRPGDPAALVANVDRIRATPRLASAISGLTPSWPTLRLGTAAFEQARYRGSLNLR